MLSLEHAIKCQRFDLDSTLSVETRLLPAWPVALNRTVPGRRSNSSRVALNPSACVCRSLMKSCSFSKHTGSASNAITFRKRPPLQLKNEEIESPS